MNVVFFFFKQKTAYEMRISDWSSDVCSSDLLRAQLMSTAAWAQTAPAVVEAGSSVSDADNTSIAEIVVTAQKRVERLQDVRSDERRVGQEGVSTVRSRWSPDH